MLSVLLYYTLERTGTQTRRPMSTHISLISMCDFTEPGPATNIKTTATSTSVAVSWTAPIGQKVTKAYQVELKDVTPMQKTWVAEKSTTFNNLSPGKSYTVVVTPIIGSTFGDPAESTFTTNEASTSGK